MLSPTVLKDPSQRLVEVLVVVFKVFVSEGHLKDQFVKCFDKVAVKKLLLE